jgi:transcriptional regulator with GAF, ATPase, and Fis domain
MAAIATPCVVRARGRVLIASPDEGFRRRVLGSAAYAECVGEEAIGGAHALAKLGQLAGNLACGVRLANPVSVLLDRNLPDLDAFELADMIRKRYPQIDVEMVDSRNGVWETGNEAQSTEVRETQAGSRRLQVAMRERTIPRANPPSGDRGLPGMIGTSEAIQQVYRLARMVAGRDTAVLLTGETGTGKELVAQAIHELSPRARQAFVVVNCAAIPEALLEAELFGHARGAYTGAVQSRLGRIHVAQGGTLFLDEVGELPLSMQAKLLRFLQNGEVQRLGSPDVHRVDVRVICATNQRLQDLVQAKLFRQDLYYRLAIFPIVLPLLRERREDIAELARHFLERLCKEVAVTRRALSAEALELLEKSEWQGNVRELQHAIERAFILAGNDTQLQPEHFPSQRRPQSVREN